MSEFKNAFMSVLFSDAADITDKVRKFTKEFSQLNAVDAGSSNHPQNGACTTLYATTVFLQQSYSDKGDGDAGKIEQVAKILGRVDENMANGALNE